MNYQMLVDRQHGLDKEFVPTNLVDVHSTYKQGIRLEKTTYDHWLDLQKEVLNKGYNIAVESGYRSYTYQEEVLQELITEKGEAYAQMAVALPGHSEHQTGLALDYCVAEDGQFIIENVLDNNKASQFTNSIAHKHGFILRYPKGKEGITKYKYEPWHLRYVGQDLAEYLYSHDMTLDEYYMEDKNEKN